MTDARDQAGFTPSSFQAFAAAFAIVVSIFYTVCEMRNWPLFTYVPATNSIYPGFYAPTRDQGPPMYWYGWIATSFLGSALICLVASLAVPSAIKRIPFALIWITPTLMVPILIYALRFFWRW